MCFSKVEDGQSLKAVVIGVGYLGRFHAQKYQRIPGVELIGVADADSARARLVGEELGVPWSGDYREFLPKAELASIVTPTSTHHAVALDCLAAGLHVLIEKPITVTLAEADELIERAKALGQMIQVGHLKRFHPAVMALREQGMIKSPRFIEAHRLAPFKERALDVDVVLDLMIHDVDLILDFMGSEVVDVEGIGASALTRNVVDVAHARLKFAHGGVAVLNASRAADSSLRAMRIFQEDAYITLDFISRQVQVTRRTGQSRLVHGVEVAEVERSLLPTAEHDTLEMQIKAFCAAVRGEQPILVSAEAGRRALVVVEAIRAAIGRTMGQQGMA